MMQFVNIFKEEQNVATLWRKLSWEDFIEFGKRLKIKETIITKIVDAFDKNEDKIPIMVDKSFLSDDAKKLYKNNVVENYKLYR